MVGDVRVFSFVDSADSCFVAGAESGDAGFDVLCGFCLEQAPNWVDDVVGRVQVQRSPKLVLPAQTTQWEWEWGALVRWPAFTVLGLDSRFGRPSTEAAPEMPRNGSGGLKRRSQRPNREPLLRIQSIGFLPKYPHRKVIDCFSKSEAVAVHPATRWSPVMKPARNIRTRLGSDGGLAPQVACTLQWHSMAVHTLRYDP